MKTQKNLSFIARRKKLNAEVMSRGFDLYRQTNISKIDAKKQYWLIIFTHPLPSIEDLGNSDEWSIRFWIWDSWEGKIAGENIVQYPTHPANSFYSAGLAECYIDETLHRLVLRPRSTEGYFIYNFPDGNLLYRPAECKYSDDNEYFYSCFVDKNLLFCQQYRRNCLYLLSESETPKEIMFGSNGHDLLRANKNTKFFYEGLEDMKYFIFSGEQKTPYGGTVILILKRYDRNVDLEIFLNIVGSIYVPYLSIESFSLKQENDVTIFDIFGENGSVSFTIKN